MTADPAVLTKFAEIELGFRNMACELLAVINAANLTEARLKVQAVFDRRQEIAAEVAILKEMQGVR